MAYYDKDKIKNSLTITDINRIVEHLGGEPKKGVDSLVARTICHNGSHKGSEKLYYYDNTKLFNCYTGCGSMDIFELVIRLAELEHGKEMSFYEAMDYVAKFFGMEGEAPSFHIETSTQTSMEIIEGYKSLPTEKEELEIEYKVYNDEILNNLNFVIPREWVEEGIDVDVMRRYGIKYYGTNHSIVIPHFNIHNDLIGVRGRTLVREDAEMYGKYRPLTINGEMYNHPLSHNLYGLNMNLDNINKSKKMIIFEGEKSVLLYESMFGRENNIALATCGSSLSIMQEEIIKKYCDVEEIVIAYDKEFQEIGDNEFKKNVQHLLRIANRLKNYFTVSIVFDNDKDNQMLDYKDAPVDKGKEVFEQLFKQRIIL